uniref:Maturation n=1 Tax=Leviviridae sp. TaxID=2027243 RepID=A0A514D1G1_9VIRU|nr:MAG: hypothetical protein H3BulkLitter171541_000002 [Leviviridae sp.]
MAIHHRTKDLNLIDYDTGFTNYSVHRDYWVGPKPFRGVQPFQSLWMNRDNFSENWFGVSGHPPPVGNLIDYSNPSSSDAPRAVNNAYSKFKDSAIDSAQNANNFLEMGQAFSSIAKHASTLVSAANAAKRLDVGGVAKALGVKLSGSRENRIKKRAKQASDLWLEYHFGWEPLVQDIGTSIDVAQGTGKASPHETTRISQSSSSDFNEHISLDHDYGGGLTDMGFISTHVKNSCRMYAKVSTSNPNAALANQMGFVNPLSVAWEAVPFSFVVDWFTNVGQCLSAMTDFVGFDLKDAGTVTVMRKSVSRALVRTYAKGYPNEPNTPNSGTSSWKASSFVLNRTPGIAGPTLQLNSTKPLGAARGATAISLLCQTLKTF